MGKSIKLQIGILLEKKVAIISFFIMLGLVLYNYYLNVVQYEGTYTNMMIQPMRLLFLSSEEQYTANIKFSFLQYYPLFVVLPAGLFYASDVQSKMNIYLSQRLGNIKYLFGKMIAVFIVTFAVFTIPLLLEMGLNCIAFPLEANGNFYGNGIYTEIYVNSVSRYMFLGVFKISPYLYALISILLFGVVSGVLAMFTVAVSMFFSKYKVLLLLPVYVLLYGMGSLYAILPGVEVGTSHFQYFAMFNIANKSQLAFIAIIIALTIGAFMATYIHSKRDIY